MDAPPASAVLKPCCVCDAPNSKHCTKCKSRHYCSKKCQLVDWKRGHNKACRQLAAEFQDRLLDTLMPEKKPKEEPPIVEGVAPPDGAEAVAPALWLKKTEASPLSNDAPSWRDRCAICLDLLPFGVDDVTFYPCCCKNICTVCSDTCREHDNRCPLCRASAHKSADELLRRLQKHVDKGNAEAQIMLGGMYCDGKSGLQQDFKQGFQLLERAAAQGNAQAQSYLGSCYAQGQGVEIDHETAAQWFQRAAEQGFPAAQVNLGNAFYEGKGVSQSYDEAVKWNRLAAAQGMSNALYSLGVFYEYGLGVSQSYDEAVKWYRLAAAQDQPDALLNLGACHANGQGVPRDYHEALRLFKRAAAKGLASAAAEVQRLAAFLAAARAA